MKLTKQRNERRQTKSNNKYTEMIIYKTQVGSVFGFQQENFSIGLRLKYNTRLNGYNIK